MDMSQVQRLIEHMEQGNKINRISSYNKLGIFELSARIIDAVKLGCVIDREWKSVTNRFGEQVRVKDYWMEV
jgi:hypothetical protein